MCLCVLWYVRVIVPLSYYVCLYLQEGQLEMSSASLELIWDVYSLVTSRYISRQSVIWNEMSNSLLQIQDDKLQNELWSASFC